MYHWRNNFPITLILLLIVRAMHNRKGPQKYLPIAANILLAPLTFSRDTNNKRSADLIYDLGLTSVKRVTLNEQNKITNRNV
jgi:hypothetical protein